LRDTVPRKPNGIPAVESAVRWLFVLLPLRRARVAAARAWRGRRRSETAPVRAAWPRERPRPVVAPAT